MGRPFGQYGPAVLAVAPLSSWCISSLLAGSAAQEAEKPLVSVLSLLCNSYNIKVLPALFFFSIPNVVYTSQYEEN